MTNLGVIKNSKLLLNQLEKPCFCCLLVGTPKSGKSYLIKYLSHACVRNKLFNFVIVISPTVFNGSYDYIPQKFRYGTYTDETILNIMKFMKSHKNLSGLVILDDCLGSASFNSKVFTSFISTYRQYNVSVLITGQYISKVPTTIRECCSNVMVFKPATKNSLNALYESFGVDFENIKSFTAFIMERTSQKHECLMISPNNESKYLQFICGIVKDFIFEF